MIEGAREWQGHGGKWGVSSSFHKVTTDETEVRHQEKNLWNDLPHSRRPCNKEDASF